MRAAVYRATLLTAEILALSIIGELIYRLVVGDGIRGFFYAAMSGGLLGFLPSAPVLTTEERATRSFLTGFAVLLLALVLGNCLLVRQLNGSDLGWEKGDYTLALPAIYYVFALIIGFWILRSKPRGQ
jgi:hypothetical protein